MLNDFENTERCTHNVPSFPCVFLGCLYHPPLVRVCVFVSYIASATGVHMDNVETQAMEAIPVPEIEEIPPTQPDSPVEFEENEVGKGLFAESSKVGPYSICFLHSLLVIDGVAEDTQ